MVPQYGDEPPYGWRRRRRYRRSGYSGGSGSCLRDACLLETGCCIGEAISDNCLLSSVLLLPQLLGVLAGGARKGGGVAGLVAAIRLYQRDISAHRPAVCRFTPSCSQYAVEALQTHGARKGLWLAARRLLRCRPGGRRGTDPVPAGGIAFTAC
jgi:putative membrane protein insertion efficiency factor